MSYKITTIIEEDGKITTDDSNQELEEIKNSIPTKLSQLENNCNFINKEFLESEINNYLNQKNNNIDELYSLLNSMKNTISNLENSMLELKNTTNVLSSDIENNKKEINNLKNIKIDNVLLEDKVLTFKANGNDKTNIDLSSLKSESTTNIDIDVSKFFDDAIFNGNSLSFYNNNKLLKNIKITTNTTSSNNDVLVGVTERNLIRDYGAFGDGIKRTIKSVDPTITLSEVQNIRSDATLDDQWDWYCLQRAFNDIAEGKYHKLYIPKIYGSDGNNMYMISKSIRIPKMAMREVYGDMSVIEQITDNEFIFEFKEEDTWGCSFKNLYLRYTNPQKTGKLKSIAIAFNPDKDKVQGGWYLNTFKNFRVKNSYTVVGPYKVGRPEGKYQIAIWSCTFDTFNIKNVYAKGFDLATGIGQPNIVLNDVRCLQDDNYQNLAYDTKTKGCFIEASATNLVIKGLDLEKWHNRIINIYGGSTLIMENIHIEHHFIDRNGGTVFGEKDGLILISNDGYYDINMFDISDVKSSASVNVPVFRIEQCNKGGLNIRGLKTQVVEGNKLLSVSTDSGSSVECSFIYGDCLFDKSKAQGVKKYNDEFFTSSNSNSSVITELPIATTTNLGAVKIGGGLTITSSGILSVAGKEDEAGIDQEEHAPDSGISSDKYEFLFNVANEGGKLADYSNDNPIGIIDSNKGALLIENSSKSGAKTIVNQFSLKSNIPWTLEWATDQTLSNGNNEGCICADKGDSNGKLLWMQKNGTGTINGITGPKLILRASDSVKPCWSIPQQFFNEKHNYALINDGVGNVTLYIDGASFGTQKYNFTNEFSVDRLLGGYWSSSKDYNFIGYMYYFKYSNSALEINKLHKE